MKLVIAEKPSVGQAIARVIGAEKSGDGYLEGNGYLVSWCMGHMVGLAPPDAYGAQYSRWGLADLPILPREWRLVTPPGKEPQLAVLKKLAGRGDVEGLVCATDAGREGELIFRLAYRQIGCRKPVERLWISSMEDEAIRSGFQRLEEGGRYDALYEAGWCRARADWLIGMNATRLFTTLCGKMRNVGRVQTPTLALLAERERAIAAFQAESFYVITLEHGALRLEGERYRSLEEAKGALPAGERAAGVRAVERVQRKAGPPKLFDLTSLQREANRLFGYSAQETLDYLQALYEKKLTTYPRTDSRYLTREARDGVEPLVRAAERAFPYLAGVKTVHADSVIDDARVTDHHAVIPTRRITAYELESLPAGERRILETVAARLACAVGEPCLYEETEVSAACGGKRYTAKGKSILEPGWKETERRFLEALGIGEKENSAPPLPRLEEGAVLSPVSFKIRTGHTTPPKHYTEDTLLAAMENAGAEDFKAMPDAEHRGLGTPATRAGIIEKLIKSGFVERRAARRGERARILLPTHAGTELLAVLPESLKSAELTARWEADLQKIQRGELTEAAFMDGIESLTRSIVNENKGSGGDAPERESAGVCPRCGKRVFEGKRSFYCEGYNGSPPCGFAIWKNDRFFESVRKKVTRRTVAALLKDGEIQATGLYSQKTGKTFDARIRLDDTGGKYVHFKLVFADKPSERTKKASC